MNESYTEFCINYFIVLIKEGDACDDLIAGECPFKKGKSYTYQHIFEVPSDFPQINTRVTINAKDDNNEVLFCGQMDVHVRNG